MKIGKSKGTPVWSYEMGEEPLRKAKKESDLGMALQEPLSPASIHVRYVEQRSKC